MTSLLLYVSRVWKDLGHLDILQNIMLAHCVKVDLASESGKYSRYPSKVYVWQRLVYTA